MNVFKDGQIAHYKQMFPNVSFPANGPTDEWLTAQGAVKVSVFRPHDRATQKLVSCDPVIEDGFAYIVEVADKTDAEIASDNASKAAKVRAERDRKLAATDWRFRSDMNPSQDWIDYCQDLRDIPEQDGFPNEVVWPVSPDAPVDQPE
jgi:hypothetical protein